MKKSARRSNVTSVLLFVFSALLILLSAGQSFGQDQPGTLDTSFNGTGQVLTDFSSLTGSVDSQAQAVAVQTDGKIVAAGSSFPDSRAVPEISIPPAACSTPRPTMACSIR